MPQSPVASATAVPARPKISPLLAIFLIVAVDVLGFTMILPLLPFYSERLGASPVVVGALVSVYAVCQLISGPLLGQWSDHIGRRPVLLISQIGTLAGFLVLAYATNIWLVFLARMVDGATAGNLSIAQAYISDITEPENRSKSFAVIGIAFGLGFLIGPAVSGYLSTFGVQVPIFGAAALSFISILCTYFLLPRQEAIIDHELGEGDAGPGGRRLTLLSWGLYIQYFKDRTLGRLLIQWLFFALSFSTFMSGFALFSERRYQWNGHFVGPREVGYIFGFIGLLGIIMQGGVVGRLVKLIGERRIVRLGFLTSLLYYAGIGFTRTIPQLLGFSAATALGGSGLRPALTSLITQRAGKREQGVILGLTQSLTSIAQIISPLIAGLLIDRHYLTLWAVWAGVLAGVALFFEPRMSDPNTSAL